MFASTEKVFVHRYKGNVVVAWQREYLDVHFQKILLWVKDLTRMAYVRMNICLKEFQGTSFIFILAHLYSGHFFGTKFTSRVGDLLF